MNDSIKLVTALIRECIDADFRADITVDELSDDVLSELYRLSSSHDVAHLVASALEARGMLPNNKLGDAFRRSVMIAVYRHEGQAYEIERIDRTLEEAGIDFIFLKGSVICKEYPKPFLRTRSDVDVLVRCEDFEQARAVLCSALGYKERLSSLHDVSFISEGGVHVELHHTLREDEVKVGTLQKDLSRILDEVWDRTYLCEGAKHRYMINDDFLCLYHYTHMAKHMLHGGCGIKPFIDIKIMDSREKSCSEALAELAQRGGVDRFLKCSKHLSDVWFSGAEHNEVSSILEQYVLLGGVYGTYENRLTVGQVKKHGRLGYIISRIFLPWNTLKQRYPILVKHRWLTPVFEVVRWLGLIFSWKSKKRSRLELQISAGISEEQTQSIQKMLDSIGL